MSQRREDHEIPRAVKGVERQAYQAVQAEPEHDEGWCATSERQVGCLPIDPETQNILPEPEETQVFQAISHGVSSEKVNVTATEAHQVNDFAMQYAETLLPPWLADVEPEGTTGAIGGEIETWHVDEASLDDEPELILDDLAIERIAGKIWTEFVADATSWTSRAKIIASLRDGIRLESEYQKFLHRKEHEERAL